MTVNLKPSVQFEAEAEKHCFESCLDAIHEACKDMSECDGCPWECFCKKHLFEESMADFIFSFKMMLLNCENEEEEEEW